MMARPKRTYEIALIGVRLTLVKGEDDDLIQLFQHIPNRLRAATVKMAMRGHALDFGDTTSACHEADDEFAEALSAFVV